VTRDGVWLAELAPVTDGADVAQTLLGALGLRDKHLLDRRPTRNIQDAESRLVDVLADKGAVLVLDNCEHLLDASARLAEYLLGQCPDVRVLATSREPLGIIGEVVLAVPPLGQPAADAGADLALEYPAVRLFADRAAAARPDFAVNDESVATVIEIVRRLDGLPLAIELAAARLRSLPAADIAERLSDRFRLLTGGSRTSLPRHRTLRAVVEWSWELLTESERLLAERVAIFPAGVIIDSAAAVCADERVPRDEVADLLGSLIDKSLLQRVGDGRRLRMLETIREYGVERLSERNELVGLRIRHAEYFGQLLADAEPELISAGQLPWLDRLADERENILAALRFRCDRGDADAALRLAIGLAEFAMLLGHHSDIGTWMSEALAVPGGEDDDLRWIATALYAMHAASSGTDPADIDVGRQQLRLVAENLARVSPENHPMVGILRPAVAFFADDRELTRRLLAEGMASTDEWLSAATRMFRAALAENDGDVALMRSDLEIALVEFRRLGERWGLANTLRSKALVDTLDGDLGAAEAAYEEALDLMAQLKSREDEAFLFIRLADLANRKGEPVKARALIQRAADSADETGSSMESVFIMSMLADSERQAGNLERARALQTEALRRAEAVPAGHPAAEHGRTIVLALSARLAFGDGDTSRAVALGREAYAGALVTNDLPITATVGVVLAEIAADVGRFEVAAEMLGAAARLRGADDPTAVDIARLLSILRPALGPGEFTTRYEHGKSLDREAALKRLDPAEALAGLT
jgi:predicted ATPase